MKILLNSTTNRVISLTLLGSALTLCVDISIAARLGTGAVMDAFVLALSAPLLIDLVFREGTKFSLVPILIGRRECLTSYDYSNFVNGMLNFFLCVGVVTLFLFEIAAANIIDLLGPGLGTEARQQSVKLLRLIAPLIIFAMTTPILSVYLNSQKQFYLAALRSSVTSLVILITLASYWTSVDIDIFIASAYSLAFMAFFVILSAGAQINGLHYKIGCWLSFDDFLELAYAMGLPSAGFALRYVSRLVERAIASSIVIGGVSAYYLAWRLFSAVQTLIASSIATVALPDMARHSLNGYQLELAATINTNLLKAVTLSSPVALICFWFSDELITLLYARGVFDSFAVKSTAKVLHWLAPGIIPGCMIPILTSSLYAQKKYHLVFLFMLTSTILNIGLAWLFSSYWGLGGIAAAASLVAVSSVIGLSILIHMGGTPLLRFSHRI